MGEPARTLLLLAGRLDAQGEIDTMRSFLDRLRRRGVSARLLCVSAGEGTTGDDRFVECPQLGQRWQLGLAVRRLRLNDAPRRPELLHVLHSSMGGAGLAIAEHWRVPYIQTVDEFLGARERLRLSRRWCRKLVAVSRELASDLEENFCVPPDLISIASPGITAPAPVAPPCSTRLAPVPVIGTAGPLVPASGFATFLNAARRVLDAGIDAEFVVAGQGEDEMDLRRRADRLRIADRVTFASQSLEGFRFWSVLDVFCLTSLVPTVGLSLARAMAAGVPSIASEVAGLRALIDHDGSGLFVPPDNSSALAETILSLLSDPEQARRVGQQGRERVLRDFHPDDEARELDGIYQSVLTDEAPQPAPIPIRRLSSP
jgi:glycosyltransferase involved in cell wall biosynthesis